MRVVSATVVVGGEGEGKGRACLSRAMQRSASTSSALIALFETGRVLWGCRFSAFCRSASDLLIRASCV